MIKKKKQYRWKIVFLYLIGLGLAGCSESDCSLGGRPSARFGFYDSETGKLVTLFDSLSVITPITADEDSILINKDKQIDHITLPFNYVGEETMFVLVYTRDLRDTLWIEHENIPYFTSMDCGISMFYQIKGVRASTNGLDSVILRNPEINDNEKENFQIYYTTDN